MAPSARNPARWVTGEVEAAWLPDNRSMRLLADVVFLDSYGITWEAPAGSKVDGASIPRFFWRVMGSPFTGRYRRASVVHDVYCAKQARPHRSVHRMFHEAMRADGVGRFRAWLMYQAVAKCGPKW